jgi:hypothetical protein
MPQVHYSAGVGRYPQYTAPLMQDDILRKRTGNPRSRHLPHRVAWVSGLFYY